ncbi:UNVERIFIED_CONTAM: Inactive beta-amylase 9 [Sesamum angustifolium]|uniref:Beta-amylase n=1 Tax=Sesamum angustifolium TaxID=2727405 RepID=A0AAW2LWL2_9LAMI
MYPSFPCILNNDSTFRNGFLGLAKRNQHYKDCLSLAVDDVPVLDGKSPVEVYKDFCESFKSAFSPFMGSTITVRTFQLVLDQTVSFNIRLIIVLLKATAIMELENSNVMVNICLPILSSMAEKHGNPLGTVPGPMMLQAMTRIQCPWLLSLEDGGSWKTPYDAPISVSGKVPLVTHGTKHFPPSETRFGVLHTANRDGYKDIVEIFSNNSCKMILPGMDLSDEHEPLESRSSPESLFTQITSSCLKYGVEVSGQNTAVSGVSRGFEQIQDNLLDKNATVDLFTYQRMGALLLFP